jgi:catechol 2,3-dioxygenase-like lactoylglutathione lyase family enzyme
MKKTKLAKESGMPIQTFDLVQLEVKNFASSVKWYVDKLGFKVLVREDDDRIAFLGLGEAEGQCKLAIYGVETVKPTTGNRCYPCFLVENLPGTIADLKRNGIEFETPLSGGEDKGFRWARLWDNEKNTVFIYEWCRPKEQGA